jgi:glycosyltransferase involved in cell wall biosynthesis
MKIGFEAKRIFTNFTGLGNYSRFITSAISHEFPSHKLFLFTPRRTDHSEVNVLLKNQNISVVSPPKAFSALRLTSLWRSWAVGFEKSMKDLDLFHGLSQELAIGLPLGLKKVVTVHDLIFMRYPQLYNPIDVRIYKHKVIKACAKANRIVAVSQQTASDLIELLDIPAGKIEVVGQGCHPIFRKEIQRAGMLEVRRKYNLPEEYILQVGTIEERKNALVTIKAMHGIPEDARIPLVLVGRATVYTEKVKKIVQQLGMTDWIHFIHFVSFEDLPAIYASSSVFVYPSLVEGFGIPIIEAIESEIPVICSDGISFKEAGGPDSIYIQPFDDKALSANIQALLNDRDSVRNMVEKSKRYVRRFHPPIIARELMDVYQKCLT